MTIQANFEHFHKTNPEIYIKLCYLTRQWLAAGNDKIGIGMLFEVLRWDSAVNTVGDTFKLNNNYRSRYVRLIEDQEKDLTGVFHKRTLHTS